MSENQDYDEIDPFYDIQQTLLQEQAALEEQQEALQASPRYLPPSKPTNRCRVACNPPIKAGSSGRTRRRNIRKVRKTRKTRMRRNKKSRSRK
jgi:hypothetical protein